MKQNIYIALVDDWELRGNGAGDVREMQVAPMRRLMDAYERHGVHGTFNVEVMQQLKMLEASREHPELGAQTAAWEEAVLEARRRGHDIQLHIHPQWHNAKYLDGKWQLDQNWDITTYPEEEVREMFTACIGYLQTLLGGGDAPRLVSFRSGSWCLAPSDFMLQVLEDNGILLDMSMVGCAKYDTAHCKLDYTVMEEKFLPFYPDMKDARKVSANKEPIICVPTFYFKFSFFDRLVMHADRKRVARKNQAQTAAAGVAGYNEWENVGKQSLLKKIYEKVKSADRIADLAPFSKWHMRKLIQAIYRKSHVSGVSAIPIVLENHTKDVTSTDAIEFFISQCGQRSDIHFITMTQMADLFEKGVLDVARHK